MMLFLKLLSVASAGSGGTASEAPTHTLHLEPSEETRLGIEVAAVRRAAHVVHRTYRGVLVAQGSAAGISYTPLSTGVDAESAARVAATWTTAVETVRVTQADLELARQELQRAAKLADGDAGSARRLDEARAGVARLEARLSGAKDRERYARRLIDADPPDPWIRVPVYLGDRGQLDLQATASVRSLFAGATEHDVRPVDGPRSADPTAGTFDVFYDADGYRGRLGEAVAVSIPTIRSTGAWTLPRHAVVYDPRGVAWVYVRHEAGTYERVRVPIRSCRDEVCLLDDGPGEGALVVTSGAAELFGHDLGMGR